MSDSIKPPETLEESLILQSHFIGIPKITKRNYKEFYRRGKILQILGVGFMENGRMPMLVEIENHIVSTDKCHKQEVINFISDFDSISEYQRLNGELQPFEFELEIE